MKEKKRDFIFNFTLRKELTKTTEKKILKLLTGSSPL